MAKRKSKKPSKLESQPDPGAPIESRVFLAAAQRVLKSLDQDLLARAKASPCVSQVLRARHQREKESERTADSYDVWLRQFVGQVGAAWILSTVFVRTLEDRLLLRRSRIAGPGALDSQRLFFELAPSLTERDYLLTVFRELSHFPAARALFDTHQNPVWLLAPSAEVAKKLLELFRSPNSNAPAFRFGHSDTRFLGDLYQDLDEDVKKRYALLQTPHFIASFILDRTLEPAIEHFGLDDTTIIDPTCGSGHFLLGAFDRLLDHRLQKEPGIDRRQAALKALEAVFGADINPYAVAIARFRLTLAFLEKAGFTQLADSPQLPLHLAVADALLHNPHVDQRAFKDLEEIPTEEWAGHLFALEDVQAARDVLFRKYSAVVGNPPYITVKDSVLRDRYRAIYKSAYRSYSLAVPFTERFFQLGRPGARVGMITANSFMKREFGKKLIQEYLPTVDLTDVVDTAGVHIPNFGATTTVILFGSARPPSSTKVLVVSVLRQDPETPENPSEGIVWRSIEAHANEDGFENEYISVSSVERKELSSHPWSLSGSRASRLKAFMERSADETLRDVVRVIGFGAVTREDEIYIIGEQTLKRWGIPQQQQRRLMAGENIRDWSAPTVPDAIWPYSPETLAPKKVSDVERALWPWRTRLAGRVAYGKTQVERGLPWFAYSMFFADRFRSPLTIAFAFVVSHNHFVLDRGGTVFNRSAPIIKLPETATEDDHLALLAYLNSSTACFWLKQVCFNKGSDEGLLVEENSDRIQLAVHRGTTGGGGNYEFAGNALKECPLPKRWQSLAQLGRRAQQLGDHLAQRSEVNVETLRDPDVAAREWQEEQTSIRNELVALQEEIDWSVYNLFGLCSAELAGNEPLVLSLAPGQRPFEIALARKHGDGRRPVFGNDGHPHHYNPPDAISASGRAILESRSHSSSLELQLLEAFPCKRRWRPRDFLLEFLAEVQEKVLTLVEATFAIQPAPRSAPFRKLQYEVLERSDDTFEIGLGLAEHVRESSVPYLAQLRLKESGLAKYLEWQTAWDLQRSEDAGERVSDIPISPKYEQRDFRSSSYWSLRGKLDVPKERFISYPGCETDEDREPVYGWAGWNHLERAQALAALYQDRKDTEGWEKDRLTPMLAGLWELIPWVKQWHNEPSDEYSGVRLGDYFESFLDGECQALGLTREALESWRPPETKRRGRKKLS